MNVTTLKSYTPDGGIATLTAVNPATGNQTTRYIYGTALPNPSASSNGDLRAMDLLASDPGTSDIARSDLLVSVIYPDATDSTDSVQNVYNRQGQVKQIRDQNGTTHQFGFDGFARRISDSVSQFGANVDQTVKRIDLAYEIRGMLNLVTSYGDTTAMSMLNQVALSYNAFAQLTADAQNQTNSGGPNLTVNYDYADGSANTIRRTSITYPYSTGGRSLGFVYNSGDDDALSRVSSLAFGGGTVAGYGYFGLGSIASTAYADGAINSTLADSTPSYPGFDQFGRLIEVPWTKLSDNSSLVDLKYGYNRASSRTFRNDVVAANAGKSFDEIYTYDGIQRLDRRRPRPLSFCSLSLDGRGPR